MPESSPSTREFQQCFTVGRSRRASCDHWVSCCLMYYSIRFKSVLRETPLLTNWFVSYQYDTQRKVNISTTSKPFCLIKWWVVKLFPVSSSMSKLFYVSYTNTYFMITKAVLEATVSISLHRIEASVYCPYWRVHSPGVYYRASPRPFPSERNKQEEECGGGQGLSWKGEKQNGENKGG